MKSAEITVAEYLLLRLKEIEVDHLFGVPGDFVLGFLNEVLKSDVQYVGTCNELNAAYAADGYARIRASGRFASTYGVGELSRHQRRRGSLCRKSAGGGDHRLAGDDQFPHPAAAASYLGRLPDPFADVRKSHRRLDPARFR